jgi:hypothetical protein
MMSLFLEILIIHFGGYIPDFWKLFFAGFLIPASNGASFADWGGFDYLFISF